MRQAMSASPSSSAHIWTMAMLSSRAMATSLPAGGGGWYCSGGSSSTSSRSQSAHFSIPGRYSARQFGQKGMARSSESQLGPAAQRAQQPPTDHERRRQEQRIQNRGGE